MNTYEPPILTNDAIIFQIINNKLCVLLINRANEPFKNNYALPGGYNSISETTQDSLIKHLEKKAGIGRKQLRLLEQLYTFDTVARDPRGHAVSVAYMGLGKDIIPTASATTESPEFYPINQLPNLAFDHESIIKYAHTRLSSKITYTNAVFALLDPLFTLTQLQNTYEAIFGFDLDKRNFRKKYLSLGLIEKTNEQLKEGAHRPAQLFKFKSTGLETLARTFD